LRAFATAALAIVIVVMAPFTVAVFEIADYFHWKQEEKNFHAIQAEFIRAGKLIDQRVTLVLERFRGLRQHWQVKRFHPVARFPRGGAVLRRPALWLRNLTNLSIRDNSRKCLRTTGRCDDVLAYIPNPGRRRRLISRQRARSAGRDRSIWPRPPELEDAEVATRVW
jgi:hypothetical protein